MIQPTGRSLALLGALGITTLLPVLLPGESAAPFFLSAAACLVVLLVDGLLLWSWGTPSVDVRAPSALSIGRTGSLEVDVLGPRHTGKNFAVAVDVSEGLLPLPQRRAPVLAATPVPFPLVPLRRGKVRVENVWLRWFSPLGFLRWTKRYAVNQELDVVPDLDPVRAEAIRWAKPTSPGGPSSHARGVGSEFDSLREFQSGHDPRHIDWCASARLNRLIVREHRAERNHQVILAFDTGHMMGEPVEGKPRLDHSLEAGLLLAYASLKRGDRVGLYAFDARVQLVSEARSGTASVQWLFQQTSKLQYSTAETNFTLGLTELNRRVKRRSLVVLFTEFLDTITAELMVEHVGHLARRHVVLFVALEDPALRRLVTGRPISERDVHRAAVAGELLMERSRVLERLRQLGLQVVSAPPDAISGAVVSRYYEIQRRELL